MFGNEQILTQPIFLLFIAFSFALTVGYSWGRRQNKKIVVSALNDLVELVKPDDQNFTNIGGAIGYHANLFIKRGGPISRVDATITLLPRHSWLYLPISKLIRKYDRLFITLYFERPFSEEAHLIEAKHAGFGQNRIDNAQRLQKEEVKWGAHRFYLYFNGMKVRDAFTLFIRKNPDPGIIRHIALVPDQKRGFVFVIPQKGQVGKYVGEVYRWIPTLTQSDRPKGKAKRN